VILAASVSSSALIRVKPAALYFAAIACLLLQRAEAQVQPNAHWRTIRTEHFWVHFTPEVEVVARRTAADAEIAYAQLSKHLHPPRGPIDVVVSDDVDFSNGYATPFPSNRIVVYANPPVNESALRFADDPTELVVTHELTHIFHLDRAGGIWKVLQAVFGRSPFLFPNSFQPSWVVEGLAVYYESLLTGSGRLAGSEHRMIARTAALAHTLPRLDQWSLANPRFPLGYSVYAYGSLFMDYLGRTHGDSAMHTFVESSSRQIIPLLLNPPSRRAFGKKFTTEYQIWAESLVASLPPASPPMPGWRDLTVDGFYASFPRWLNDSTLIYTGTPGRESYGAYLVQLGAQLQAPRSKPHRIGRRSSNSPNSLMPDGSLLYAQLEYTSPYNLRSDLYVERQRGGTRRLTHGARLTVPDARADGLIAAVQTLPGGTRIVLVSSDGTRITPITNGDPDEQWTEPRWSPDGRHIAAVRWTRGGTSSVVVMDTTGRAEQTLVRERTVNASPSWSSDGRFVYFSSDRTGVTELYQAAFHPAFADTTAAPVLQRVSQAVTGLFAPQRSPAGRELAAVVFRADGYHVGIAPFDSIRGESAPVLETVAPREPSAAASEQSPATPYSPWRTLVPRFWMPFFESALDSNSVRFGALVSGRDVVGRHGYEALLFVPSDNSGLTGSFYYRNAGLGQPIVELVASQDWQNRGCISAGPMTQCVGVLRRRIRDGGLSLTFQRPRVRSYSYASVGGGVEVRDYAADPMPLLGRLDPLYRRTFYYPRVVVSAGWSHVQRPPMAISPEDGISLSSTARYRWRSGDNGSLTSSFVGAATAYKSLDLPGFAHHVVALRAAGGAQDNRGTGYYEIGGVSGGTLDVFPGYVLGEGRRTFGVRGFSAASLLGIRAYAGSMEYRAPFALPGRGLGTLPFFLDRMSVTLFGDAGSAWCPGVFGTRPAPSPSLCTSADVAGGYVSTASRVIASVGAELNASAAILSWDAPFLYRLGFAAPVAGTEFVYGPKKATVYFAVGASF
jgi:hypothetical protein